MDDGKIDVLKGFLKEIGGNVKKQRVKKGMSMEDLGLEVGLDRMNINRIEKGLNMTLSTILKISLALEIKPQELLKTNMTLQTFDLDKLVSQNRGSKLKKNKTETQVKSDNKLSAKIQKKKK